MISAGDTDNTLPCPFCGGTDLVEFTRFDGDGEWDGIECAGCRATAPVEHWDIRTTGERKRKEDCLIRCSECEGTEGHHWMPVHDEGMDMPVMACKHCPATRPCTDSDLEAS